jgi:predicted nucleotidyltransferase
MGISAGALKDRSAINLLRNVMRPLATRLMIAASSAAMFAVAAAALQPGRAAGAPPVTPDTPPMMHHAMPGHGQPAMSTADPRELVNFPPQMRTHMLGNMRDHVETLNGILQALAAGDYDDAAKIAAEHLGLDSPSAASCKPKQANAPPPAQDSMDAMMALYMPEAMRGVGLAMHTAASDFAVVAKTHDAKATMEALSRVTPNCVACHASYRLQ